MNWKLLKLLPFLLVFFLAGCSTPHILTLKIYEDPNRVVRLQTIDQAGFSHPAFLTKETVANVMRGVMVEIDSSSPLPFMKGSGPGRRQRAFSEKEITFFAPLLAKGLSQATSEEVVTFFETVEISDQYEMTTSGGIFVKGDQMHVMISNFGVRRQIWQDNEQYEAPFRTRPLEPIASEPGRLEFEPRQYMGSISGATLGSLLKGRPWQVAVRYRELIQEDGKEDQKNGSATMEKQP